MQITIDTNQKRAAEIDQAARFFANILLHPRTVENLVIDIDINKRLDVQGECICDSQNRTPRAFTIGLRGRRKDDDIIKTLAHEMVHVKQYAKNQIGKQYTVLTKGRPQDVTVWEGTPWLPKKNEDPYYDSPWELEAYGREVGLYARWKEFRKITVDVISKMSDK